MTINYIESEPFKKDLKKLLRRFKTLDEDLKTAKKSAIELLHVAGIDNNSIVRLTRSNQPEISIYKLRKFACKVLKGRGAQSGIRIIYALHVNENLVEFLEIYFKADQKNPNQDRITTCLVSQRS